MLSPQFKWLVDVAYPDAQVIRVVLDNLNVLARSSLYVAFPAPEARRLARKLDLAAVVHVQRGRAAAAFGASQSCARNLPGP